MLGFLYMRRQYFLRRYIYVLKNVCLLIFSWLLYELYLAILEVQVEWISIGGSELQCVCSSVRVKFIMTRGSVHGVLIFLLINLLPTRATYTNLVRVYLLYLPAVL